MQSTNLPTGKLRTYLPFVSKEQKITKPHGKNIVYNRLENISKSDAL